MPKAETQHTGALGEDIAVKHLVKHGYRILDRNFRKPWGEIDIVAEKNGVLVFIEVKALTLASSASVFRPEDHFTRRKMARFRRAGQLYAQSLKREALLRLDLIAIEMGLDGSAAEIRHIEGVEAW